MIKTAEAPAQQSVLNRTGHAVWPHPRLSPRWMAWVPQTAILWPVAYGAIRVWWTIHGEPGSGPLHINLMFFTGWNAVALCATAAVIAFALRTAPWFLPLPIAAWAICVAHLAACPLLLLDIVGGLLPGLGVAFVPAAFLSRAACLVQAILLATTAVAYRRRWRSECLFCGRTGRHRAQPTKPPRWAWWAAYAAVAGCLVRLGAQVAIGFSVVHRPSGVRFAIETFIFEAAFLLAGTLLPLSLVHAWGRILPPWMPYFAGRAVPRWLPLGPASAFSALTTVYFTLTFVKVAADTFSDRWHQTFGPFPAAFFWFAVPGYLIWGLGLGIAAISYYRITRPFCRICGQ